MFIGYLLTHFESFQIVFLKLPDGLGSIEPYATLIVQKQAAVIQIDRTDNSEFIITHKGFGMNKTRGVTLVKT